MVTALDPEEAWHAIYTEAKRALRTGRIYHSPIKGQRYRVSEVTEKYIEVARIDAKVSSDVGKGQVLSSIEKLNDSGGVCPRGELHSTVAKETTIVTLHPQLRYDDLKENVIMGDKEQINLDLEKQRRFEIWEEVKKFGGGDLNAADVQALGIYKGQAGIYRSLSETRDITDDGVGIAIGLSHSGKHYPDDLTDESIIYHYPKTDRLGDHDRNEIEATKNCMRFSMPVFVILREGRNRIVKFGWVKSFDDKLEEFFVEFAEKIDDTVDIEEELSAPFKMRDKDSTRTVTRETKTRKNQAVFKYKCLKKYQAKCAVCDVSEKALLDAAHIYPKSKDGSDHAGNGLIFCATHHRAFDNKLFGIKPDTTEIVISEKTNKNKLQITKKNLNHLENLPHQKPLKWKWRQFRR